MNRSYVFVFTVGWMSLTAAVWASPQENPEHKGSMMEEPKGSMMEDVQKEMEPVPTPIGIGNKICPISGKPVEKMGGPVEIEHNGKLYNLCCKMCAKDFQADPEKFMKKAEEEMKAQDQQIEGETLEKK
jgi:YHS domain-containing protein